MKIEILTEKVVTEKVVYEAEIDEKLVGLILGRNMLENPVELTRTDFYAITEHFENLFLNDREENFKPVQTIRTETEEEIEDIQIYTKDNKNLWKIVK